MAGCGWNERVRHLHTSSILILPSVLSLPGSSLCGPKAIIAVGISGAVSELFCGSVQNLTDNFLSDLKTLIIVFTPVDLASALLCAVKPRFPSSSLILLTFDHLLAQCFRYPCTCECLFERRGNDLPHGAQPAVEVENLMRMNDEEALRFVWYSEYRGAVGPFSSACMIVYVFDYPVALRDGGVQAFDPDWRREPSVCIL